MKPNVRHKIEHRIHGIPCLIGVYYFKRVKGSFSYNAPSDLDYYGYNSFTYELLDSKGYRADWLSRKVTDRDEQEIETAVAEYFAEN